MYADFRTIGIIGKPNDLSITDTLHTLVTFLTHQKYTIIIACHTAQLMQEGIFQTSPLENIAQHCDVIIALGGDGTFLTAARLAALENIPLIGVNLGKVGFLVDITPSILCQKLTQILAGEYNEEYRYLLRTKIIRANTITHEEISLNEVVVHRWVTPSMIKIVTHIDGHFLNAQRSDGLIISTPTGSTAYALSAGGPIIHPRLNALVLVPLNPHTLSNRPIVIEDSAEIEITFEQTSQINALVTCDHLEIPDVLISDRILIKKDPTPLKILHPIGHDFFETLRKKLYWSNDYLG
jgi:NAD+ kinase